MGEESFTLLVFETTKEVSDEQSWVWLQNGDLNRETESHSCSTEQT